MGCLSDGVVSNRLAERSGRVHEGGLRSCNRAPMAVGACRMNPSTPAEIRVAALYRFCRIDAPEALRKPLAAFCCGRGIKGTLLIAREGINGTVAGSPAAIDELIARLEAIPGMAGLEVKFSSGVRDALPPHEGAAEEGDRDDGRREHRPVVGCRRLCRAGDWNALIADPDTVVIDTRNDYEVALGAFRNAVDPGTASFREFPDWVARNRSRARRPQDSDVLHRRHTLREGDRLCPLARDFRGLSSQGRHPEISGNRAGRAEPVARRVLRLRRARLGDAWARPKARPSFAALAGVR